jgi:hypothetical protein
METEEGEAPTMSTNTERAREFLSSVQPPSLRYEIAHVAAFASELDAAERRGMERACLAACGVCMHPGDFRATPVRGYGHQAGDYYHLGAGDHRGSFHCRASAIRALMEPKP